jgi:hypothetical protein
MLLRFPVLPAVFLFGAVLAHGQKYSNEFLSIGVGARAQAMGNSVIANVNDVTTGVWNPAGLAAMDPQYTVELGAMHSEWFAGLGKFDYLAATLPLANPRKRLAFSVIRFGIDNIPNTLSLYESDGTINFDNLQEFSAADYAFLLSYGQPLSFVKKGELLLGGSVKVVHRRIGPFANSWGFGLDAGLQYRLHGLRVGFLAKDITTTFNAWSFNFSEADKETLSLTGNEVPINSLEITRPQLILGVGYAFQWGKVSFLPELNLVFTTDGRRNTLLSADPISMDPSFGLEVGYNGFVFLRGGLNQFQRESDFDGQEKVTLRPSMGVGLRIGTFFIDYAFTDPGDQRNIFSHVFSLRLAFRKKKS